MNKKLFGKIVLNSFFSIGLLFMTTCNSHSDKERVTVAQYGDVFIYLPIYLAQEKGFFQEEGLDVHIISTGGDDKTYAAVIGGSAQFGVADPTFAAIAAERGGEGYVIANIVNGVPFWGISFNENVKPVKKFQELGDIKIVTFPSPSTAYVLQRRMFSQAGLQSNIQQATMGALIPTIKSGKADIALELEPNVSSAVKEGAHIVFSMANEYEEFAFTGVTVSKKFMKNNPDIVQKFVNAITKSLKFSHENQEEVVIFAKRKYKNIDPDIIENATRRMISSKSLPLDPFISPKAWENALKVRKDTGELFSVENSMKVLDMSYANKAMNNKS
ncbi:ABC transporter substrate-binding protein [Akkermansia massiliensis]|uniref:ABC transporter substrate-binding protein n=1 Tax=Akkermansia massiliensis TaxID=2927224 RepID=UPI003F7B5620